MMPARRAVASRVLQGALAMTAAILSHSSGRLRAVDMEETMLQSLKPFATAVGSWAAVVDAGKAAPAKEKIEVSWGFRESDGRVSINFFFEPGGTFAAGLLTADPKTKQLSFVAKDKAGKRFAFRGALKSTARPSLQLLRDGEATGDDFDRLELTVAKGGDKLLIGLSKRVSRSTFKPTVSLEAFREGPSNHDFEKGPHCPVTGGPGRVAVTYNGVVYHVACEATKELALKNPQKWFKQ